MKKKILIILAIVGCLALWAVVGQAEEKGYPDRQITFIIPYDPGGSIDIQARVYVEALKEILNVAVVPENKPGAGGALGMTAIKNAKPDGYTIGAGSFGAMVISPIVQPKLPYKRSELTLVAKTVNFPIGLFVLPDAPWKNLKEFADYARANPGKIRAAVGGPTGAPALMLEAFKIQAGGLDIINIPSKGGGSMATALLGGHVEICSDPVASEVSLLKAGRVRALAVSDKAPGLPQLPTFAEAGFPGVDVSSWAAVVAPHGIPKPVLDKLAAAFSAAAKHQKVIDLLHKDAMNADFMGPEAFAKQLEKEDAAIRVITKKVGLIQ